MWLDLGNIGRTHARCVLTGRRLSRVVETAASINSAPNGGVVGRQQTARWWPRLTSVVPQRAGLGTVQPPDCTWPRSRRAGCRRVDACVWRGVTVKAGDADDQEQQCAVGQECRQVVGPRRDGGRDRGAGLGLSDQSVAVSKNPDRAPGFVSRTPVRASASSTPTDTQRPFWLLQ